MKTINPPKADEVFEVFRELGAEEFTKTPAHMLGRRLSAMMSDAGASNAGAEEKGLLTGFLDVLASKSLLELAEMNIWTSFPDEDVRPVGNPLAVNLEPGKKVTLQETTKTVVRRRSMDRQHSE